MVLGFFWPLQPRISDLCLVGEKAVNYGCKFRVFGPICVSFIARMRTVTRLKFDFGEKEMKTMLTFGGIVLCPIAAIFFVVVGLSFHSSALEGMESLESLPPLDHGYNGYGSYKAEIIYSTLKLVSLDRFYRNVAFTISTICVMLAGVSSVRFIRRIRRAVSKVRANQVMNSVN